MKEKMGPEHDGPERQEASEAQAERIVREEMKRRQWNEENQMRWAKGHEDKVAIAVGLRLGSPGHLHNLLHQLRKAHGKPA
jgi:hypothetical protein